MILFSKIRWKNFLSFGNQFTEVDLTKSPTTLIVGENGAGKSTFLDAITFVLYGKAFRKINKPQLVNTINGNNLLVEIEFSISGNNYLIRRGVKPNVFEIFENDELIDQEALSRDYQDFLEKHILKMNYTAFTQVVVLGKATYVPFMRLKSNDRRGIIEELLGLKIFSKMNDVLKVNFSNLKSEVVDYDFKIEAIKDKIELHKQYEEKRNEDKLERQMAIDFEIQEIKFKVDDLKENIKEIKEKRDDLYTQTGDYEKFKSRMKRFDVIMNQFVNKIKSLEKDVVFFEDNDTCPTCKQNITEELKNSEIEKKRNKINELSNGYDEAVAQYDVMAENVEITEQVIKRIKECDTEIDRAQYSIDLYEENIIRLINRKNSFETEDLEVDKDKIETLLSQYESLCDERSALNEKQGYYMTIGSMLKDTGIKAVIVNKYLPIFNNLINQYLTQMGFFVKFHLDETFNETILSRYKDKFSYASFSEGEKLRIDLAILLTWREVAKLKNALNTNLLIMDEIFDSSLDQTGVDSFIELLPQMEDVNMFVISHTPNKLADKFRSTFRFEKHKNFSRLTGE